MMQIFHHRSRQIDQVAILADDNPQIGFVHPADFANAIVSDSEGGAALPGSLDEIGNEAARYPSLAEELPIGATNRRHVGGGWVVFHSTSSSRCGPRSRPSTAGLLARDPAPPPPPQPLP